MGGEDRFSVGSPPEEVARVRPGEWAWFQKKTPTKMTYIRNVRDTHKPECTEEWSRRVRVSNEGLRMTTQSGVVWVNYPTWLAIDDAGYPYPISPEEHTKTYEPVQPCCRTPNEKCSRCDPEGLKDLKMVRAGFPLRDPQGVIWDAELTPDSGVKVYRMKRVTGDQEVSSLPPVDARDFGAVGDGVADDTSAVQEDYDKTFTPVADEEPKDNQMADLGRELAYYTRAMLGPNSLLAPEDAGVLERAPFPRALGERALEALNEEEDTVWCPRCRGHSSNDPLEIRRGEAADRDGAMPLEPDQSSGCSACALIADIVKHSKTNRGYWLATELFMELHDGADYCSGGKAVAKRFPAPCGCGPKDGCSDCPAPRDCRHALVFGVWCGGCGKRMRPADRAEADRRIQGEWARQVGRPPVALWFGPGGVDRPPVAVPLRSDISPEEAEEWARKEVAAIRKNPHTPRPQPTEPVSLRGGLRKPSEKWYCKWGWVCRLAHPGGHDEPHARTRTKRDESGPWEAWDRKMKAHLRSLDEKNQAVKKESVLGMPAHLSVVDLFREVERRLRVLDEKVEALEAGPDSGTNPQVKPEQRKCNVCSRTWTTGEDDCAPCRARSIGRPSCSRFRTVFIQLPTGVWWSHYRHCLDCRVPYDEHGGRTGYYRRLAFEKGPVREAHLRQRDEKLRDLELVNEKHRELNGELRERIKELEPPVKMVLYHASGCGRVAAWIKRDLEDGEVIHASDIVGDYETGDPVKCASCGEVIPACDLGLENFQWVGRQGGRLGERDELRGDLQPAQE